MGGWHSEAPKMSQPASLPHEAFSSSPSWRSAREPLKSYSYWSAALWDGYHFLSHLVSLLITSAWEAVSSQRP